MTHKLTYETGDVFEGTFNKQGLKHGVGRLKFADGTFFEGFFKDGLFNGFGNLTLPDGSKYEGQFENGKYNGYGTYTRSDGICYEGSFQDGRVYGNGKITHSDGSGGNIKSEGVFEGNRLVRRENSQEAVELAKKAKEQASRMKLNRSKAKSLPH